MIDWRQRIDDWLAGLFGRDPELPFLIGGVLGKPFSPPSVSLIDPVQVVPAARHSVTFHADWGLSPREGSWSQVRALWRVFANRSSTSPYERPTIYKEPEPGGAGAIDGQPVTLRTLFPPGIPDRAIKVQEKPTIGYPHLIQIRKGYEVRESRIFFRDRSDWLHWKFRVYFSTATFIDTLPRIPIDRRIVVKANLHFGVTKRCIKPRSIQKLEEAAAKLGKNFPVSKWAVETFRGFDPGWWKLSDLKSVGEFQSLKKA